MIRRASLIAAVALAGSLGATLPGSAQEIQERTIRWGHLNNTDHPVSLGVKRFAEIVAARSGGKLKVREFPANQLGSEMQQQSALRGGTQEMQSPATTSLAGIVKEFGLIDFPFIVSTPEQADALLDGPFGTALLAKLPEMGLVGLGYWDLGFRNVTNSKRPITKGEDLEGLKIRVIPNPVYLETFKTFGANPLPLSFSELYQRARDAGRGWSGEPILGDPVQQVLRSSEVRQRHAAHLQRQHHPGVEEVLGQAVAGGADDPAGRGRSRRAPTSARSAASRRRRRSPASRRRAWR